MTAEPQVQPVTSDVLESVNPATGEVIGTVPLTDEAGVRAAVARARAAQPGWAAMPLAARQRIMRRLVRQIVDQLDTLAALITRENGRPPLEALTSELLPAADLAMYYIRNARKMARDERLPLHLFPQRRSIVHYAPIGVIAVIAPWNYPFLLPFSEVFTALMAGNAVVFKPSELTPLCGQIIGDLFQAAGLPPDVLQIVQGDGRVGAALVQAGVGKVSFTGSTGTAKKILKLAAETLTPVLCELGGKDPMIVLDDANLDRAADAAVWGGFMNAGQTCAAVERVYVDQRIAQPFIAKVVERTKQLRIAQGVAGNEDDFGPMINERQRAIVERHVADAREHGAHILTGGKRPDGRGGFFYEPTVLTDVPQDRPIMQEETFGPVLPISTFATDEEAVTLANDSIFGLSAYVFSENRQRAMHLARQLEAGSVLINNVIDSYGAPETPWGGVKQSGIGRIHWGVNGLREYMEPHHIMTERIRPLRKEMWWFPYSAKGYRRFGALVRFLFGRAGR